MLRLAQGQAGPRSALGQALAYAINQEKELRVFLDDPKVAVDNNVSERGTPIATSSRSSGGVAPRASPPPTPCPRASPRSSARWCGRRTP